jgi:glycosyltransferase involved in cell wall biosynthesis
VTGAGDPGPPGLTVALVATAWAEGATGGSTFEDDVLHAALSVPSHHRFVVYPDSPRTRRIARDAGAGDRASFVAAVREPDVATRLVRRALRAARLRPPFVPHAALSGALRGAGAEAAWMLGGSLVAPDLPYLATVWDLGHRTMPWFPETSAGGEWRERERLNGELVRRASAVLVGTMVGEGELRAAYGEVAGGYHVLPLPTPSFALAAAREARPPRPAEVPPRYLFYPARFWAHKNHVTAVWALAALRARGDDAPELVLAGSDAGTRDHVMSLARRLGVADSVHCVGFVSRERLVALYAHAEAMLFPSLLGPDNLPPLEAMALGCPVIAARVAGAEEQLGDAAILVDGLDAGAFADAVAALAGDRDMRSALVKRGRVRAACWDATRYASAALRLVDERIAPVRALWGA